MERAVEANEGVLAGIGSTPLIELRKVVPPGSARVLAKLEFANPTGSMKDRMAVAAIEAAERRTIEALGATVEDVPSDRGRITEQLIKAMITPGG